MKKLIILAVIGLVAGLGGGTGIAIVMKPAVVADSTAVDSTAAHKDTTAVVSAAPDAAHGVAPADTTHAVDSTAAPKADSASASHAPADSAAHDKPAPTTPTPSPAVTVAKDSVQRAGVRRISRIFAAMAPREASKVLQQLADSDVTVILSSLSEKQAAAILMAFPAERAATISRGSLRLAQGKAP